MKKKEQKPKALAKAERYQNDIKQNYRLLDFDVFLKELVL